MWHVSGRSGNLMVQNIVRLPETAHFIIHGLSFTIENHKVTSSLGLYQLMEWIMLASLSEKYDGWDEKMQQQNISCEAVIECCAKEMEENVRTLAQLIWKYYSREIHSVTHGDTDIDYWNKLVSFSSSNTGREIAAEITEKIRDWDDWDVLCREMNPKSAFHNYMRRKIKAKLKWYKV